MASLASSGKYDDKYEKGMMHCAMPREGDVDGGDHEDDDDGGGGGVVVVVVWWWEV